jgi:hypothetical protein
MPVVLFLTAVTAEVVWLGVMELESWNLANQLGQLQHMGAMIGATPFFAMAWYAARRWRLSPAVELGLLMLGSLAIHAVLWFEPLQGTSDGWRYLWDGLVQANGVNPYQYAPDAMPLESLRIGRVYYSIYRPDLPTCYPPVAEMWFWISYLLGPEGFQGLKAVLLGHDLVTIPLLWLALRQRGQPGGQAVLFGLAPLFAVQHMVGMHLDALYAPWLAAALLLYRRRPGAAGAAMMVAAMVRPLAVLAIPALMWKRSWRDVSWIVAGAGLTAVACVWPYRHVGLGMIGSIPAYMMEWEFNSAIYGLLKLALCGDGTRARWICYCVIVALAVFAWTRGRWSAAGRMLVAVGAYYLLTPTLYPWYLVMVLVPWTLVGGITPVVLGAIVALSETVWIREVQGLPWSVPTGWLVAEYALLATAISFDVWRGRRRRTGGMTDAG